MGLPAAGVEATHTEGSKKIPDRINAQQLIPKQQ
jgi:hypothetical protein